MRSTARSQNSTELKVREDALRFPGLFENFRAARRGLEGIQCMGIQVSDYRGQAFLSESSENHENSDQPPGRVFVVFNPFLAECC
jgi:hypothetical protein